MIKDELNRMRERTVTKNGWIVYPKIHVQKSGSEFNNPYERSYRQKKKLFLKLGKKKYSPEQVIQDEVNPIRERIKNFSANNIWNADETAIFIAILSTEKETILKAWEKTNLKADFDFDRELENQDVEEEFLLQIKMNELMINDEDEATGEDSEIIDEPVLVLPAITAKKK